MISLAPGEAIHDAGSHASPTSQSDRVVSDQRAARNGDKLRVFAPSRDSSVYVRPTVVNALNANTIMISEKVAI